MTGKKQSLWGMIGFQYLSIIKSELLHSKGTFEWHDRILKKSKIPDRNTFNLRNV